MKRLTTEKAVSVLFFVLSLASVFCSANRGNYLLQFYCK